MDSAFAEMVSFFSWFLLVAVATLGCLFIVNHFWGWVSGRERYPIIKWSTLIVFLVTAFSPFYYEFPRPGFLFGPDGKGGYKSLTFGTWEWRDFRYLRFDVGLRDDSLLILNTSWDISATATPIASNPKSRKISYHVQAHITSAEEYFRNPNNLGEDFFRSLKFHLYEFNEARSKELAELYNPLDKDQQDRFRRMLSDWLSEALQGENMHGVELEIGDFYLLN